MKTKEDASVKINNLVKTYTDDRGRPTFTAVKNINLDIKDGEFMVLGGPVGLREVDDFADGGWAGEDFERNDFDWGQGGQRS